MRKLIGLLIIISAMVGMYYYVGNSKEIPQTTSNYFKIMRYDFNNNYPTDPYEVLDLYCETIKYLYGEETISKEINPSEIEDIIYRQRKLLDKEVLDLDPESSQYERAKLEIQKFKDSNTKITSIKISKDIKQETEDIISFSVVQYTNKFASSSFYEYYLRKNIDNKWKVLGWKRIQ